MTITGDHRKRGMSRRQVLIRFLLTALLFSLSGFISTCLYCRYYAVGGIFFPGIGYTSSTVLLFRLTGKSFSIRKLGLYYAWMIAAYLFTWFLTMLSSWLVAVGGIITAGTGAVMSCWLVKKYITPVQYQVIWVWVTGSAAFLLTDILYFSMGAVPDTTLVAWFFNLHNPLPQTAFAEVLIFWQMAVGTKLFFILQQKND